MQYQESFTMFYNTRSLVCSFDFNCDTQKLTCAVLSKDSEEWEPLIELVEVYKDWHYSSVFNQFRAMLAICADTLRDHHHKNQPVINIT